MTVAYNCDCISYMKTLPDKAFDWIVADPPYSIGADKQAKNRNGTQPGKCQAKRRVYHTGNWDNHLPSKEYFDEVFRVSKNQIIWGGNYMSEFLPSVRGFICWDKRPMTNAVNDYADCEYAWCSQGVARMFRFEWTGMLQGNMKTKEDRCHPAQKPVALYKWIYKHYAHTGDKILDTHLGSGSSRIAAEEMGLDFVGCEIDKVYFDLQEKRFADYMCQPKLEF